MMYFVDVLIYSLVMQKSMHKIMPGILNHSTSKALGKQHIPLGGWNCGGKGAIGQATSFPKPTFFFYSSISVYTTRSTLALRNNCLQVEKFANIQQEQGTSDV